MSNEKKSLLVSINNSGKSSNASGGYDSLNTVTTPLTLPLNTTPSSLENTLLSENRRSDSGKNEGNLFFIITFLAM